MGDILKTAVALLKSGEVIAAPTDTVYGLIADATNSSAVAKIYNLKQRPITKPLVILVSNVAMARKFADFSEEHEKMLKDFWTIKRLPLTVVLKAKKNSKLATAGGNTVALRVPNHKLSCELIRYLGGPIVASSANISGIAPATTYKMVKDDFGGKIPLIIDGGTCKNTSPSTILDLSKKKPTILREGSASLSNLLIWKSNEGT
ncbi:MAG: threonylcarbamoyl-AMP synthase [Holosporales bacterium]|nr:threonylcarbamoyl-AMP synthase [Holosporales bacterium]